jgi:dTDP-4-dehydrorhamnose 3,5-epimerase
MRFRETPVAGSFIIELEPRVDERGSFARAFCQRELAAAGVHFEVRQANVAHTVAAGIVRGLHYQVDPPEQKVVRCTAGAVFNAIVDVRPDSPTRLATFHLRLDPVDRFGLFVPAGVAHGYQALEDRTEVMYLTDQFYEAGREHGVRYCDPALAIPWPITPRNVTSRDEQWPLLDAGTER